MAYQITHVRKDNDGDILEVKGTYGQETVAQAVRAIDTGLRSYYTSVNGNRANVTTASNGFKKYLRSYRDGTKVNNLDYLPEF